MFYEFFLDLCESVGKSPTTVIEEIGLGRGNITNWKNGAIPSDKILRKIAIYFDVPQSSLLEGKSHPICYYDPTTTRNRVFKTMNDRHMSLDELAYVARCSPDEIRNLAFSKHMPNMRQCLERVAIALDANPLFLIGKSNSIYDDGSYDEISDEMWEYANNNPQVAIDSYNVLNDEVNYVYGLLDELSQIKIKDYFRSFSHNGIYLFVDRSSGISKKKFDEIVHFIQFVLSETEK